MFTTIGVPPDMSVNMMVTLQYVKALTVIMFLVWLYRYHRTMHLRLSPQDQYRATVRSLGFDPYSIAP